VCCRVDAGWMQGAHRRATMGLGRPVCLPFIVQPYASSAPLRHNQLRMLLVLAGSALIALQLLQLDARTVMAWWATCPVWFEG
jgi:hypothetical protein